MCRLFAQLSPTPESASAPLSESRFSLLKQSDFDGKKLQKDGWGVAVFGADGKADVVKSPKAVFEEKAAFRAAASRASAVVIGHLRAASNPRGLERDALIDLANTQPFSDGRWVFAHNGTLEIPEAVAENLGPLASNVKSLNDSEIYFWQFLKHYSKTKDAAAAFQACVDEDWALWEANRKRYAHKKSPYTSLNALVSDGKSLHAFCHATAKGMAEHAVCTAGQPWSRMSFGRRGSALLVCSEPVDDGAWTLFDPPEVLSASVEGGAVSTVRKKIKAPQVSFSAASREGALQ
jgi:predicted glutamine amidotransferase